MAGVIQLRTEIPGPNSRALLARRAAAVPRGVPAVTPIAIVHAEGAIVTDADGNRLIDFGGGIGVVNTGHRHPGVVEAVRDPTGSLRPRVLSGLHLRALRRAGGAAQPSHPGHPREAHLHGEQRRGGGGERGEGGARLHRPPAVVCFEHGFSGRTNLALALTSKVMPYKKGFGPFAPEVYRIPYPYCYRVPRSRGAGGGLLHGGPGLLRADSSPALVDPQSVAAIVMELELGEGGFVPAPRQYVTELAAFARDHGILFVADEIQTGFGRTGVMFASEHYDLVPDIITTAKSLAGGLPLAAVTGRADVMEAAQVGGLGGTYGGNPLACAAALAVLDAMERERIPERARRTGETISARFRGWADRYPGIGDVRGLGAMIGMELVTDRTSKTPDKALTGRLLAAALERGLILLSAGTYGNVVRVLAPLTIEEPVLRRGSRRHGRGARGGRGGLSTVSLARSTFSSIPSTPPSNLQEGPPPRGRAPITQEWSRRAALQRLQDLRGHQGRQRRLVRDPARRVLLDAGPLGLRQDDHAPAARRLRAARRGRRRGPAARRGGQQEAALRAQDRDGLPELRAVPPPLGRSATWRSAWSSGRRPRSEIGDRVRKALEMVRLKPDTFARRMPAQLSGGQRQRVALARALVLEPDILLLDEPLGAIDLKLRKEMQLELKSLNKQLGTTFVYVTHDQEEALTMSDRIAVMDNARVAQLGTPAEIYENPRTGVRGEVHRRVELLRRHGGTADRTAVGGRAERRRSASVVPDHPALSDGKTRPDRGPARVDGRLAARRACRRERTRSAGPSATSSTSARPCTCIVTVPGCEDITVAVRNEGQLIKPLALEAR